MSVTETQLCNLALATVGVASQITSLTDGSQEARICSLELQPAIDSFLEETLWNRATKRVELSALSSTPDFEWTYEYLLPADFVKIRQVNLSDAAYKVELNATDQLVIVTNAAGPVNLTYISRISVGRMSGKMIEALKLHLASQLARSLKNDFALASQLFTLYRASLARAKGENMREGTADSQPFYDTELAKWGIETA